MTEKIRNEIIKLLKKTNWEFWKDYVKVYYKNEIYFLDNSFLNNQSYKPLDRNDFESWYFSLGNEYWVNKYEWWDALKESAFNRIWYWRKKLLSYKQIWDFSNLICLKRNKDFWFMVNKNSISLNNVNIKSFNGYSYGVYLVSDINGKSILINWKWEVLNNEYSIIGFNDTVTFATINHTQYFLINNKWERLNNELYDDFINFYNWFAQVVIDTEEYKKKHHKKHDSYEYRKWFYINTKWERIWKINFSYLWLFTEDWIALVWIKENYYIFKKDKYNFIDRNWKFTSNIWFDSVEDFSKGKALVRVWKEEFYVNKFWIRF